MAALFEEATVRIGVAGTALFEGESGVFDGLVRHRMTLLASDVEVGTGQGETRLAVVESAGDLPLRGIVAALAFRAEPALVFVVVTTGTSA